MRPFSRRLSPSCLVVWIVLATIVCCTWLFASWAMHSRRSAATWNNNIISKCNMTGEYQRQLELLLAKTHQILQLNQLDHFLCYGTLWGQIRYARLLPWATRAYLCVFDEQMAAIDPGVLWSGFQQEFLQLRHSAAEGSYTVQRNHHAHPQVELVAFGYDAEQDVYRRSGWRRRLLPPSCDWSPALDCFPANLVRGGPLPQRRLGRFEYAVPQAGIEIQKYNYEDNWWRAVHLRQEQCPLSVGQMIGE